MISSSGTSSKPCSVSMPFKYLIGLPLGSWIMRKAIEPSLEVAGKSFTGTRTRDRRRLPDQTGMGAMGILGNATDFPNLGQQGPVASEQRWTPFVLYLAIWSSPLIGKTPGEKHHEKATLGVRYCGGSNCL